MPDDGGPDVVIKQLVPATGDNIYEVTQFRVRFTDDFWHRLYAGLAMQSIVLAQLTNKDVGAAIGALVSRGADAGATSEAIVRAMATAYADGMIAHNKNTEADGETDNERG